MEKRKLKMDGTVEYRRCMAVIIRFQIKELDFRLTLNLERFWLIIKNLEKKKCVVYIWKAKKFDIQTD